MNVADILEALREFPPSMRLIVRSPPPQVQVETTVIELTIRLAQEPPDVSMNYFGRSSFILREHQPKPTPNAPPQLAWLTMDWR